MLRRCHIAAFALLALSGCGVSDRDLGWIVSFDDPEDQAQAVVIEATITAGCNTSSGCDDLDLGMSRCARGGDSVTCPIPAALNDCF